VVVVVTEVDEKPEGMKGMSTGSQCSLNTLRDLRPILSARALRLWRLRAMVAWTVARALCDRDLPQLNPGVRALLQLAALCSFEVLSSREGLKEWRLPEGEQRQMVIVA
jgi:hypothetical protein